MFPSKPDRRSAGSDSDWVDTEQDLILGLVGRIGSSGPEVYGRFSCRLRTRTGNRIVHTSAVAAATNVLV